MTSTKTLAAIGLLFSLCACTVGPRYKRPAVNAPDQYRGAPSLQPAEESFGAHKWKDVFQDETLQALVEEALANNYDLRLAASRVLQAGAVLGITRANQFPSVDLTASLGNLRTQPFPGNSTVGSLFVQASWVLDFWGQFRRATEAARANLLATQYGQAAVQITLISSVASNYFLLRQFDAQLEYSADTVEVDKEILKLNTIKFKGGEAAIADVYQAQLLLQQAEAQVIAVQQLIEQTENQISILLGRNPAPVARGLSLTDQPHAPEVPVGIPSAILQSRPDVLRSEQALVAANANVGVAKAAFFPQFSLTGAFGLQSASLQSFLGGPTTGAWTAAGQVAQPLFQGGRIKSNYRLAWAQRDEAELVYKQSVLQAFGDVSNALVGYRQSQQFRKKLEEQTATYKDAAHLAKVRFEGGYTPFLEVLVTQQQYFTAQLDLAQAWYAEMQNYVQLYLALGGGWQ